MSEFCFTANQIARAAGISRQAVMVRLKAIPADAKCSVNGQEAAAWSFNAIPLDVQLEITRRGVRRGFKDGQSWLSSLPAATWSAPIAWDKIPAKQQAKAVALQKALSKPLEQWTGGSRGAELDELGLKEYQAAFGYPLSSARHWRKLLQRTIERDAGEENWQRLEIYVDDRAFRAPTPRPESIRGEFVHRSLGDTFATLQNRQDPTPRDRQFLWDAIFQHFEILTSTLLDSGPGGRQRKRIKASLVRYVFKAFPAGALCASEDSLRRRFDEKREQWLEKGRTPEALEDRRHMDSGNFRKSDFTDDLKLIRDEAIKLDGNESLAYRMLREQGKLSEAFCDFYQFDPRTNKSLVPTAIREAITPDVEMCLPIRRGPKQARMSGPHTPRDWSLVRPGDWFCADDVTWNHYFKYLSQAGEWKVTRGECLVMTDLKTGYPLDFLLIPRDYNGGDIRSLVLKVHDRIGLPRVGFYFERGVWASKLVTGDRRQGSPVHLREAENGLCRAGLEIKHATTPRAKPIEGSFHILQDRMRCIPGFVGFNERTEKFEREQELIARAQRGEIAALDQLPTMTEWRNQVRSVLQEFAKDPQNGKMLQGQSPAQAWSEEILAHPLRQLVSDNRWILSTHQKRVQVKQAGILLTIRGRRLAYYNEQTGSLIGRDVLAYYNIEMPELLTVCDLNHQNYFTVKNVELPAMSATPEQLAEVNRLRKAHTAPAKGIFGELQHTAVSIISKDNEFGAESAQFGQFHREEVEKARAEQSAQTRKMTQIRRKAADEGISVSENVRNPDRVLTGIERAKAYRERILEEESANPTTIDE